ncbi:hypothetical protein C1701_23725 [Actinoalloteichus sp. AHMU CJ021]|nr:hypothetical protein C1701_23725 [Actinoalloteichus sp. AHMU CJ021]
MAPGLSWAASAARSVFPLTVRGSRSTVWIRAGSIALGRRLARWARSCSGDAVPTTEATSIGWVPRVSTTAACSTPVWSSSADSISPSSMRTPRSFTWPSVRPRLTNRPRWSRMARSPVRYIRVPGGPKGFATNRCAVSAGRPRYPLARQDPVTWSSPWSPGASVPPSRWIPVSAAGSPNAGSSQSESGVTRFSTPHSVMP